MAPKRRPFAYVDPALKWMVERRIVPDDQRISSEMPVIRPPLMQAASKAASASAFTTSLDKGVFVFDGYTVQSFAFNAFYLIADTMYYAFALHNG